MPPAILSARTIRHLATAPLCLLLAAPLVAQSTQPAHVAQPLRLDANRLVARRDSFAVVMRGATRGWQVLSAMPEDGGWTVSDAIAIEGMVSQASRVHLDAALGELSLRQEGTMGGKPMRITLDRRGARVTGTALTPTHPAGELAIDVEHVAGLLDDNALTPLLAAVPWSDGLVATVPVLSSGKGTISQATLTTLAREQVTVPAGQFDAWKVQVALAGATIVAHVTAGAPYRVVRMQLGPAFEVQLVR